VYRRVLCVVAGRLVGLAGTQEGSGAAGEGRQAAGEEVTFILVAFEDKL